MTTRKFHYSVYVVLLNPEVVNIPQIKRRNPKRDPLKPCVYVGLTGLPQGRSNRRYVAIAQIWIRLMPELYEHLNPMPCEKALHMARKLAADLRAEGYTVTNGVSENTQQYPGVKAALDFHA
jgi:hypothetical protein